MIIVTGTVSFARGGLDKVMPAAIRMMEQSRAEDGCILYVYTRDFSDPDLMHVSEQWRDRAALDAHFGTEHLRVWRAALAKAGMISRDLTAFESDGGVAV